MSNTAVDESRFPLNRIVAFLGPYISVVSGALASWLLAQENVLGLFNLPKDKLAAAIAQGAVFLITTGVTWAGHHKWLTGHQMTLGPAAPPAGLDPPAVPFDVPPGGDDLHAEPADLAREQAAAAVLAGGAPGGGAPGGGGPGGGDPGGGDPGGGDPGGGDPGGGDPGGGDPAGWAPRPEPDAASADPPVATEPGGADPLVAAASGQPLPSDLEEAAALPDDGADPHARVTPDSPEVLA